MLRKLISGFSPLTFLIVLVLLGGGLTLYSFTYPDQLSVPSTPSPTPKQN